MLEEIVTELVAIIVGAIAAWVISNINDRVRDWFSPE